MRDTPRRQSAVMMPALVLIGCVVVSGGSPWPSETSVSAATIGSDPVMIQAAGRGNPYINFEDGRMIPADFTGPSSLTAAMTDPGTKGLALASADFDEDGMPDLVATYGTVKGGLISLRFGNVDAVHPNAPEAKERRKNGTFVSAPFLPDAKLFETPERPDFVGAGDFDADGHWDVVAARRGGTTLSLHRGDGKGGLLPPENLPLPGAVTALATGDVNRRDGLEDVLVGVTTPSGPQLLVFEWPEGALRGDPEVIPLPEPATGFAIGQMDEEYPIDIAVAAGKHVIFARGRDRSEAVTSRGGTLAGPSTLVEDLGFRISSLAVLGQRGGAIREVAMLDDAGYLHAATLPPQDAGPGWSARLRQIELPPEAPDSFLVSARVSTGAFDDLLLVRRSRPGLMVVTSESSESPSSPGASPTFPIQPRWFELETNAPFSSALPMRLNKDVLTDFVLLGQGGAGLTRLQTAPLSIFVVTNTDTAPVAGSLTLAVYQSSVSAGFDEIQFNIPGPGVHTLGLDFSSYGYNPPLVDVSLDATTQPGYAGTPLIEIDGTLGNGGSLILKQALLRGLAIYSAFFAGIDVLEGNTTIEGNYVGTDASGQSDLGNRWGIRLYYPPESAVFGSPVTIGGTVAAARNVIAGHDLELNCNSFNCTDIAVLGNYIGVAADGVTRIDGGGSLFVALSIQNDSFGSTTFGSRNVIASPSAALVIAPQTPSCCPSGGNLIQGNYIGLDASGQPFPGASSVGILLNEAPSNTIGGTSVAARNIISSLDDEAVLVQGSSSQLNLIEGNRLGTSPSGTVAYPNRTGIRVSGANSNTVGGLSSGAGNQISVPDGSLAGYHAGVRFEGAQFGLIAGNVIGTDPSGTSPLGTPFGTGILLDSGACCNVISDNVVGNFADGIELYGVQTFSEQLHRNYIGTDPTGASAIPNLGAGLLLSDAGNNEIGGSDVTNANLIKHNGGPGIAVVPVGGMDGLYDHIRFNSISENGTLGIDLDNDGVTPNDPGDADTGANTLQNFPLFTLTTTTSRSVRVVGSLNSMPNRDYQIDVYSSPACDPSGYGEGASYVGTLPVHTDSAGDVSFGEDLVAVVYAGSGVSATATDPDGNTSEFSACRNALGVPPGFYPDIGFVSLPGVELSWDDVLGADFYHVYRGTPSGLFELTTSKVDSCSRLTSQTTSTGQTLSEVPDIGGMFWYLVTAEGLYGEGGAGDGVQGPRQLDSSGDCPDPTCSHAKCSTGGPLTSSCNTCVASICQQDSYCCTTAWDDVCVQEVRTICGSLTCGESAGQCAHTLCSEGGVLALKCDEPPLQPSCVDAICAQDSYCCTTAWDSVCVGEVSSICGYNCD